MDSIDSHDVLALLKLSLPVMAFVSVVLGRLKEWRREGPDGEKHFTFHGRILTGLTILSAFVTLFAAGFDTLLQRWDKQAQAVADQQKALADIQAAQEAELELAEAREFRDEQSASADRIEARQVRERLGALARDAAEQRRDAAVARRLAEAAAARLSDAQRTIAEFARINDPLRTVSLAIEIELNLPRGGELEQFWQRLIKQHGVPFEAGFGRHRLDPNRAMELEREQWGFDKRVVYAANANDVNIVFHDPASDVARSPPAGGPMQRVDQAALGKAAFVLLPARGLPPKPQLIFDLVDRTIKARFELGETPEHEGEFGGRKLSVGEARAMVPVLQIRRKGTTTFPRGPDRLIDVIVRLNGEPVFGVRSPGGTFEDGNYRLPTLAP